MRKLIIMIGSSAMLVAALCLAGCGGSSSSGSASAPASQATSASAPASTVDPAKVEYDRASALFDEGKYYSAKEAFEASGYGDWEQRAAQCIQAMPETGELWHNEDMVSDSMELIFEVNEDDSSIGRYIVVYTKDRTLAETLFFQGGGSVETWLPGGNYYIKLAQGTEWYGEDELFGRDGHYESMVFDEVEGDRYLTVLDDGYAWSITINTESGAGQDVGSEETDWESWN